MTELVRCSWCTNDPIYIAYHDQEWGVPVYDDLALFEMLNLEGMQAGLSWITILKRREHYRAVFHHFDPVKIAAMTEADVLRLMQDPGIIRNRLKIEAIIKNAQAYLRLQETQKFSDFLWSFVGGKPIQHAWPSSSQNPVETPESKAMSKTLKKLGFSFVGSTICYAFMQAVGMVNDHAATCFRHPISS